MKVALAILNFEGIHHLEILLPTAIEAVRVYGEECPILVLDNQSKTNDVSWVQEHFPQVEVILAPANDYLFSYNWLLERREEEVVVLLNSDLRLDPHFIRPLLKHFSEPNVFAVTSLSYNWEGTEVTSGPATFLMHHGWFYTEYNHSMLQASYTLYPTGGYMAVDREKFMKLGGFDRLYYPVYGEDLDLGYRAWLRGWASIYEPESKVWHRENGTMTTPKARHFILVSQFLFQWRNLRDRWTCFLRAIYIRWLRYQKKREGDDSFEKAYLEAKSRWSRDKGKALQRTSGSFQKQSFKEFLGSPIQRSGK
ncbi:MAG: glycosyltransferase [Verrucomicrobiota bacterium]